MPASNATAKRHCFRSSQKSATPRSAPKKTDVSDSGIGHAFPVVCRIPMRFGPFASMTLALADARKQYDGRMHDDDNGRSN